MRQDEVVQERRVLLPDFVFLRSKTVSIDQAGPRNTTYLVNPLILHRSLSLFVQMLIFVNLDHDRVARSRFGIGCRRHFGGRQVGGLWLDSRGDDASAL
jgi:hypothetical protein